MVHRALEGRPGVQRVKVDLQRGEVAVTYDDSVTSPERLAELMKAAGFSTIPKGRN
ncbi:MAG: heavy-metal-associated domain-containing protein [Candidatus Rokubacteria bacterium]|nr:heavy-metal-associated domain-containing protein [Candidatus Rokubacteria bacterium]